MDQYYICFSETKHFIYSFSALCSTFKVGLTIVVCITAIIQLRGLFIKTAAFTIFLDFALNI